MNNWCGSSITVDEVLLRRGRKSAHEDGMPLPYVQRGRTKMSITPFLHLALLSTCFAYVSSQQETPFRSAPLLQEAISTDAAPTTCDAEKRAVLPCRCCKLDCWHAVVDVVSHELGHVPGEEGDAEARATLQVVRSCMIAGCRKTCTDAAATHPKTRRRSGARYLEQMAALADATDAI